MRLFFILFLILQTGCAHIRNIETETHLKVIEEITGIVNSESLCYSKAMVGYDSVINSRLGVLPKDLVKKFGYRTTREQEYMKIMLDAYQWEDTPHRYAISIFFNCAASGEFDFDVDLDTNEESDYLFDEDEELDEEDPVWYEIKLKEIRRGQIL